MARHAVLYHKGTMTMDGVVSCSQDDDLQHNLGDPDTHGHIEVPPDHPVLDEQHAWRIEAGRLVRKPDVEIVQIEEERRRQRFEQRPGRSINDVLLGEINELRAERGKPRLTMEEVRGRMVAGPDEGIT